MYKIENDAPFVQKYVRDIPMAYSIYYRTHSEKDKWTFLTSDSNYEYLVEPLDYTDDIITDDNAFNQCYSFPEKVLESYNIIEYKNLDKWIKYIYFNESDELSKEIIIEGKRGDQIINQLLKFKDVMEYWFNNNTQHKSFFEIQKKILRHPQIAKERFKPSPDFRTINFKNNI